MHVIRYRRPFLGACALASALLLQSNLVFAQVALRSASGTLAAGPDTAALALADSIRDLQQQVQTLNAQMKELRAEQQRSGIEASELRRELQLATAQLALRSSDSATAPLSSALPYSTAPGLSSSASPEEEKSPEERVAKLEDDLQLTDAKLSDQYQTKVESGSKYRLRLSGLVLLNMFENRGTADNMDYPQVAVPQDLLGSAGSFGGSLRQSQIGLEVFGPDVAGARTSANVKFDFAGGFPDRPNGVAEGLVRLRTGTIRLDWKNTSLIAGQDSLFFVPLTPTSLASVAVPALSYAGNLWGWVPQARLEHRISLSEGSTLQLQGGILDSLSGDYSGVSGRYPSWGEESNQPAYAGRAAWSHAMFGQDFILGVGGYYGRQYWGLGRSLDGWAGTVDLTVPLGKWLGFTAAFYRGRAVNGLGGGIGQGILIAGSLMDPHTPVRGLNSMGGWAQLKFKPTAKLEVNTALGIDNPFAGEMRRVGGPSYFGAWMTKNVSPFANFIYHARSNVLFSVEYRRLQTFLLDSNSNTTNHLNASVGYIF